MKKTIILLLIIISYKAVAQEHWEDNFWRDEAKRRYSKTMSMAGLYTTFYKNGQIKWQGKCLENGNPDSTWVYYNENGKLLWKGNYTGKYYEFRYDYRDDEDDNNQSTLGDTAIIGNYKNGLKNGDWFVFDQEGEYISKKGQYVNGEPTGIWQEFRNETVVTKQVKYSEYSYSTQTQKFYKKDSITDTKHIDSLKYAADEAITLGDDDYTDDVSVVNYDFIASAQYINLNKLNNFFIQPGYKGLQTPLLSGGIGVSGEEESFFWSVNFNWTPAITSQLNDSVKLRLSGYNTSFHAGVDLINSKWVDLVPSLGIGFQQLKLKVTKTQNQTSTPFDFNEGDYRVYKNPSPTFDATLNLRFNLKVITLNFAGGYILDCSSTKWRYNGKYLSDSPRTSVSGLVLNASIGIHID